MITYDNQILIMFLTDVSNKKINSIDTYLKELNLSMHHKNVVEECIKFCFKRNIIHKNSLLLSKVIWNKSRIKMILLLFVRLLIFLVPIIPIYVVNKYVDNKFLYLLIQFYTLHLSCVFFHESFHSLCYWVFKKDINGYYVIDFCNCSFVYNECNLKVYMKIVIAMSGTIMTIIAICLLLQFFMINIFVMILEIFFQLLSLIIGSDAKIAVAALKKATNEENKI